MRVSNAKIDDSSHAFLFVNHLPEGRHGREEIPREEMNEDEARKVINERVAYAMNKPYKFCCIHFPNEIKEILSYNFYPQEYDGKNVLQLYSNGFYYGSLSDGKRNGCGAYYWDDGDFYLGDWESGERTGEGLFIRGGYIYYGQFLKGHLHGHGCEYNSDNGGVEVEGDYSEDKLIKVRSASDDFRAGDRYYNKDSKSFTSDKEAMWGCLVWIIIIAIIVKCCS